VTQHGFLYVGSCSQLTFIYFKVIFAIYFVPFAYESQ